MILIFIKNKKWYSIIDFIIKIFIDQGLLEDELETS